MPMLAMNGRALASDGGSPSCVVSTAIASSAAPVGFSANSVTRLFASIFISPNSDALSRP